MQVALEEAQEKVVKLFYPSNINSNYQAQAANLSPSKVNYFPKYSISFYDDINLQYKRQSFNGKQVLSTITSDDFFSSNQILPSDSNNYINGFPEPTRIIYIQILVHASIQIDSIGNYSNIFILSLTKNLGNALTKYYSLKCISQNNFYTQYICAVSLSQSDFINNYDCQYYCSLIGDFNISLNYPIYLNVTNNNYSGINQSSNAQKSFLSSNNSNQYFSIANYNFSILQNYFPNTSTVFDTTNTYLTFSGNQNLFNLNFNTAILASNLKYFGFTIYNSDLTFNPNTDTSFALTFRTQFGNLYRIESCTILKNFVNNYWNIIFNNKSITFYSEYVDYAILEINLNRSTLITSFQITFLSYLNTNINYNSFSTLNAKLTINELKNLNFKDLLKNKADVSFFINETSQDLYENNDYYFNDINYIINKFQKIDFNFLKLNKKEITIILNKKIEFLIKNQNSIFSDCIEYNSENPILTVKFLEPAEIIKIIIKK